MSTSTAIILAMMLVAQAACAPQATNAISSTIKTPANLSYEELLYITQMRNGGTQQKPRVFTPCARAILGCCKNNKMNESCSESLNCGAFFFDDNPCDEKFVRDALNAARSFYQQQLEKDST